MNNNEDNNSPVNEFTIIQSTPEPGHFGSTVILKYAILDLLLKLCTILGSLVQVAIQV